MTDPTKLTRRGLLAAAALAPLAASSTACAQQSRSTVGKDSRILVTYFTRSDNTRVIAEILKRALGADLFQIRPARPYPEDYKETVEQARQERDRGFEPALATRVGDITSYDTLFLGFPIWGGTAPPIIRSFLSAHDLADKMIHPFITHGGYGEGNSAEVLSRHIPAARLQKAFIMEADQERRTINQVNNWLGAQRI